MVRATSSLLAVSPLFALACGQPRAEARAQRAPSNETGQATRSLERFGQDLDHAVEIAPGVWQARATGNAHAVSADEGRVIFDCGLPTQAARLRALLDAVHDALD